MTWLVPKECPLAQPHAFSDMDGEGWNLGHSWSCGLKPKTDLPMRFPRVGIYFQSDIYMLDSRMKTSIVMGNDRRNKTKQKTSAAAQQEQLESMYTVQGSRDWDCVIFSGLGQTIPAPVLYAWL